MRQPPLGSFVMMRGVSANPGYCKTRPLHRVTPRGGRPVKQCLLSWINDIRFFFYVSVMIVYVCVCVCFRVMLSLHVSFASISLFLGGSQVCMFLRLCGENYDDSVRAAKMYLFCISDENRHFANSLNHHTFLRS